MMNFATRRCAIRAFVAAVALVAFTHFTHAQTPSSADSVEKTFKANCSMCHGDDGAGSVLGKRLQTPDLRTKEIQKLPNDTLQQTISAGKKNMPPFGTRLDSDQIKKLIDYVRSLQPKDPDAAK